MEPGLKSEKSQRLYVHVSDEKLKVKNPLCIYYPLEILQSWGMCECGMHMNGRIIGVILN